MKLILREEDKENACTHRISILKLEKSNQAARIFQAAT